MSNQQMSEGSSSTSGNATLGNVNGKARKRRKKTPSAKGKGISL